MQLKLNFEDVSSERQDHIDLLVLKILRLVELIKQEPLLVRAQLLSLLENELSDVIENTFDELESDKRVLILWSNWYEGMFNGQAI